MPSGGSRIECTMKNISVIFFDIDNTLLNHTGAETRGIQHMQEKYFPLEDSQTFKSIWDKQTKLFWQKFERKELTFAQQRTERIKAIWQLYRKAITNEQSEKLFQEYLSSYESSWKAFPEVIDVLERLNKQGIRLGILSNGAKSQQLQKLQIMGIDQYIDPKLLVVSEEAGFAKPEAQIFQFAQERAQTSGSKILFIGDNPTVDIAPARKYGWNALLIDYFGKYPDTADIKSLAELGKIVV